ncbi:MAG: hypothetical protein K9H18_04015 [Rhodospirillum sp.]|nr:hypothetical protein [Rhodospirillum sp.]MCF8502902.1 hypothetical protein [Rhodospirillum sp.]
MIHFGPFRKTPLTIRGGVTVLILISLLLVISLGRAMEVGIGHYWPQLEDNNRQRYQGEALAALLRDATPTTEDSILSAAVKAGFPIRIMNQQDVVTTPLAGLGNHILLLLYILFVEDHPPEEDQGMKIIDGEMVLTFSLDETRMLLLKNAPYPFLSESVISQIGYYLIAFVTFTVLFSHIAGKKVTSTLSRLSERVENTEGFIHGQAALPEEGPVEIQRLCRALNDMRDRILAMLDARVRLIRAISHDLRTPLTRLRLRAERIPDEDQRRAVIGDLDQITALVEATLGYLRDGKDHDPFQKVDLASLLSTVADEFSDVGLPVSYEGPNHLVWIGAPGAMARAISNLCDNGVRFASAITLRLTATADRVQIDVADNGPGIDSDLRDKVLEPFQTGDPARERSGSHQGFGLGLSIMLDIVRNHGGDASLLDNPGGGLLVRIDLPRDLNP